MRVFELLVQVTVHAENEAALDDLVLLCDRPGFTWRILDVDELQREED